MGAQKIEREKMSQARNEGKKSGTNHINVLRVILWRRHERRRRGIQRAVNRETSCLQHPIVWVRATTQLTNVHPIHQSRKLAFLHALYATEEQQYKRDEKMKCGAQEIKSITQHESPIKANMEDLPQVVQLESLHQANALFWYFESS